MKWIKNTIAAVLAVILVVAAVPPEGVFASGGTEGAIYVQNQSVKAGSQVNVEIVLQNNPGIAGAILQVEYDTKLTLQNVINGDALGGLTFTKPAEFGSPSRFLWDSESGMSQKNGVLLTLQFVISAQAISGEKLPIHISYTDGDIFNEQLQDVNLQISDGTITVEGTGDCKTDGHKYGTVRQKIEGSEIVPAQNECLKQGSYKTAFFCEKCGEYDPDSVKVVYTTARGHVAASEAVIEHEVAPTHKKGGSYDLVTRCQNCGEVLSSVAVITERLEHTPGEAVKEHVIAATHSSTGSYDLVVYCADESCKEELSRSKVIIEKIPHTPGEAVKENIVQASCTANGSYDLVVYCTDKSCKAELSRTQVITDKASHKPGKAVKENIVQASHKAGGSYDIVIYCMNKNCNEELMREHVDTEKQVHTAGAAVKENVVKSTCKAVGGYDLVVYCTDKNCKEELMRDHIVTEKLAHLAGVSVEENVQEATCTEKGRYDLVVYCTRKNCKAELLRKQVVTDKTAHVPGNAVKENEKKATCTKNGSYDSVIYCTECGTKISSTKVVLEKLQHKYVIDKEVAPTESRTGLTEGAHCSVCKTVLVKQKVLAKLPKKTAKITVAKRAATFKEVNLKNKSQAFRIGATVVGNGKITYKKVSGSNQLILSKTGMITAKQGTKKGTYKMVVQISAAESAKYKAVTTKITATVTVK